MNDKNRTVVVIGAGIAGIQAALDLGEMGVSVHLIEESASIGGRMAQLDKTFPTNDCSMCILSPKMSECARHKNISLHIKTEIMGVTGKAGDFRVRVMKKARYVDPDKCVSCGVCETKCPVKAEDEFDVGLRKRGAISRYFLQSIPSEYTIDPELCLKLTKGVCGICEKVCPAGAINYQDKDKEEEIEAGAIILAGGIKAFDPIVFGHFGYKRYRDVVTSLEFERMLSASGPLGGHVVRASDKREPKKIAFIQCVGSRDESIDHNYCSAACCMFAIKEAIIAQEHIKGLQASIFYMDIRAYGKDFDKYYEKAKNFYGVQFIKSKVAEITKTQNDSLKLKYVFENGEIKFAEYDLVVLSIGLEPRLSLAKLADKLDIKLNEFGFCRSATYSPLSTSREGILACGAVNAPRDIPESVTTASAAVAEALKYLKIQRQDQIEESNTEEIDVRGERPRIGVFVCHCGINIAGVVDVESVAATARELPNVEQAEDLMYACSQDCMNTIKKRIREKDLNRIIVAACTPRTHEPLFRETISEAGLNPYLFEMANIRDQCSWAHMNEPKLATEKAIDLVKMAVAKARELTPLKRLPIEITPDALVIGGGLAGITSAMALADAGFKTHLVEREAELGGNMRNIYFNFGNDPQKYLASLIHKLSNHPLAEIHTSAEIGKIEGYVGNYSTTIWTEEKANKQEIEHGVVIVATGAVEHETSEYCYGKTARIVTLVELEEMLIKESFPKPKMKNIVMIQCVGSREEDRMYCSRICCTKAVKNALNLKKKFPNVNIYIAYRDIRTYGFREKYYTELRDQGAVFVHYGLEDKPEVTLIDENDPDSRINVSVFDPIINKEVVVSADLLVLATAIEARAENEQLAKMLKVSLNNDGMFLEAHVKLRPVDFATEGVFLAGLAHGPKDMDESITQAKAAAGRAITYLSRQSILAEGTVAEVDENRCSGCGYCEAICAYKAIKVDKEREVAEVNEALCKGCGACVASCRCAALNLKGFSNQQLFSVFESLNITDIIEQER